MMAELPFTPVLLWSDILLWLLFAVCVAGAVIARRSEHILSSWRRIAGSRSGMAAMTVLAAFFTTGLLDSVHYRPRLPQQAGASSSVAIYGVEVLSLLDTLAAPLKNHPEKTYSAPLATRLFSKETLEEAAVGTDVGTDAGTAAGTAARVVREYPRLVYGSASLGKDDAGVLPDVLITGLTGAALGLVVWLILSWPLRTMLPAGSGRKSALATLAILLLIFGPLVALSAHYHVFGTDKVGQDVFYLTLKSIRTGLIIGTLTTLITLPAAVLLGILAGYAGGWVDDVVQYLYTTLNSIPGVLLIAAAVLMMQVVIDNHPQWFATSAERADARLLALCAILGMTSWTGLARLLRGEALKLRELEYVQAALAFGVSRLAIMLRHILPNVMHIVLISVVMDFSGLVLAEAVLSYVGIGVDPSTISFGTMINAARLELAREPVVWWSLTAAFAFMFALVLAANLFADVVRDAFDPRTRMSS